MPACFSASIILADALCVQGAISCNETTNERLGVSAANIGRKSAATASVMVSNFPLRGQPNKAKMGAFDNGSPLSQNRAHAADHVRRLRGLRKIDPGETVRQSAGKVRDRSSAFSGARRHRDWRSYSAFAPAF